MMAPILGPRLGGWIVDNWSAPIFYVNLPIGLGFFLASDLSRLPPRKRRVDVVARVHGAGFGALQLHDRPGREVRLVRLRLP
jgi:MFS family permease